MQDTLGFIKRKLGFHKKERLVGLFLEKFWASNASEDEIIRIARHHFQSNESDFYNACHKLVEQLVIKSSVDDINIEVENFDYQDLSFLIKIANSFGRFDVGYLYYSNYCHILEKSALKSKANRSDKVKYLLHKQLFGSDGFHYHDQEVRIRTPFYLMSIQKKMFSSFSQKDLSQLDKIDSDFQARITNKTIALLAPGITQYSDELIQELAKFDEIVVLNYSYEQYQDLPLPIRISYYSIEGYSNLFDKIDYYSNLDFCCLKIKNVDKVGHRQIHKGSIKWFLGSPNMAQNAIHDLLCFNPKKIKVFGMNFFLAQVTHHEKYISGPSLLRGLAHHNPITNYLYINRIFDQNVINCDYEATKLLNQGVKAYVSQMTNKYSLLR